MQAFQNIYINTFTSYTCNSVCFLTPQLHIPTYITEHNVKFFLTFVQEELHTCNCLFLVGTNTDSCNNKYIHNTSSTYWYEMPFKINILLWVSIRFKNCYGLSYFSLFSITSLHHIQTAGSEQIYILQVPSYILIPSSQ